MSASWGTPTNALPAFQYLQTAVHSNEDNHLQMSQTVYIQVGPALEVSFDIQEVKFPSSRGRDRRKVEPFERLPSLTPSDLF